MLRSRYLGSAEADGSLHSVFEVLVREQFTNPHIRAAHRFFPPFSQQHRNHIRGLMHWSDRPASWSKSRHQYACRSRRQLTRA